MTGEEEVGMLSTVAATYVQSDKDSMPLHARQCHLDPLSAGCEQGGNHNPAERCLRRDVVSWKRQLDNVTKPHIIHHRKELIVQG